MSVIDIEWLSDSCECETCGTSYADGASVTIDGELILDLTPHAHCYDGTDYQPEEVYKLIFKHLGHELQGRY